MISDATNFPVDARLLYR